MRKTVEFETKARTIGISTFTDKVLERFSFSIFYTSVLHCSTREVLASEGQLASKDGQNSD
jgi:hypothetical protein